MDDLYLSSCRAYWEISVPLHCSSPLGSQLLAQYVPGCPTDPLACASACQSRKHKWIDVTIKRGCRECVGQRLVCGTQTCISPKAFPLSPQPLQRPAPLPPRVSLEMMPATIEGFTPYLFAAPIILFLYLLMYGRSSLASGEEIKVYINWNFIM